MHRYRMIFQFSGMRDWVIITHSICKSYNCNKPGHIAHNCPEPHMHRVHNADVLSPETIQAIAEAVKVAVGGNTMWGEEAVDKIKPVSNEPKDF